MNEEVEHGYRRYALTALLVAVLHYVLARHLEIFDVRPNFLLMIACVAAIALSYRHAILLAFACGLVADLFTTTPFGISALAFVAAAVVAHVVAAAARQTPLIHLAVLFGANLVGVIAYVGMSAIAGEHSGSLGHVAWVALVIALVNGIVGSLLLLVPVLNRDRAPELRGVHW